MKEIGINKITTIIKDQTKKNGIIHVAVAAAGKAEQKQQDRCKICKRLFHIHPPDSILGLQE